VAGQAKGFLTVLAANTSIASGNALQVLRQRQAQLVPGEHHVAREADPVDTVLDLQVSDAQHSALVGIGLKGGS